MDGKYLYIKSQANNLVLTVRDGKVAEQVVLEGQLFGKHSLYQLWFLDHNTSTIRPKENIDVCVESDGDILILQNHQPRCDSQIWNISEELLINGKLGNSYLTVRSQDEPVENPKKSPGMYTESYKGWPEQLWDFEYQFPKFYFFANKKYGKVLDVSNDSENPGAHILIYDRKCKGNENQLWYEDKDGIIHSRMTNFVLESKDEKQIVTNKFEPDNDQQQWLFNGKQIFRKNKPNLVLDCIDGKYVICDTAGKNSDSQTWILTENPVL